MPPLILVVLCATLVVLWFHLLSYTDFFVGLFALFIPIELVILAAMIRGVPGIVPELTTVPEDEKENQLIFMVISRESPPFVQESVDSVHDACRAIGYSNYRVLVVTDVESNFAGAEMVIVPADYRCNAAYKARALNYALRVLPNSPSAWTFHLDEDAQVRAQTVAAMLHYIATEGQTKYVAFGFQSAGLNRSLWGYFAEADRAWTMVWHRTQMGGIPLWANGGNMLIRSDIEQEATWNLGSHICEDTVFEYKVAAQYGPIFGWHGGTTMERAPSTIRGLVKQRRRWFHSGLLTMHLAPKEVRTMRMYCIITWVAAFVLVCTFFAGAASYVFGIPKWSVLPLWLDILIAVMTVFWLARAQVGLYLITRHRDPQPRVRRRFAEHLVLIFATPVVSLFCVLGPVVSLVAPPKSFEITDK
jgi:cellulose synthase/poly-beta-1,6-N-acetylglucosamine synthase-like glycosyltransferase